jgi:antitoxin HigA-1
MSRLLTTIDEPPLLALPAIHPGEVLRGEIDELGMSPDALAQALDLSSTPITELLDGQRSITADTALRLARYFGTSARFWMNLQLSYELAVAEQIQGRIIAERVRPRAA